MKERILQLIPDCDKPGISVKAIAIELGAAYGAVSLQVQQLEARGLIWKLNAERVPGNRGTSGHVYVKADTSGYSHLMESWEAELVKTVEEHPDELCFCAWYVHARGYLDELIARTALFPNRHKPFQHFHIVWSFRHTDYLSVPGCYMHDWTQDTYIEIEKFTEQKPSLDWLLTQGVALKRKGLLPDGRPLPKTVEELLTYKQADAAAQVEPAPVEPEVTEPVEVVGTFRCGHPMSHENSKKKSGAGMICRQCFEERRRKWRARVKAESNTVDVKKYNATDERIQRIEIR